MTSTFTVGYTIDELKKILFEDFNKKSQGYIERKCYNFIKGYS